MPIFLYGCENWILNQQQIKRLEATEMWFIRRMQKISWKEKKTNEQVLRETIGKWKLIQKIVQRQVSFFGHVMRKGQLENIVTTAKINGKRRRGKPSIQYMDQFKKWTQQESIESLMSKIYERTLLVAQVYWQGTQRRRRSSDTLCCFFSGETKYSSDYWICGRDIWERSIRNISFVRQVLFLYRIVSVFTRTVVFLNLFTSALCRSLSQIYWRQILALHKGKF